jgi:hypothetical protein
MCPCRFCSCCIDHLSTIRVEATKGSGSKLIGVQGKQTDTYIAGIYSSAVSGVSRVGGDQHRPTRGIGVICGYRRGIQDMGPSSAALMKLRPVTFPLQRRPGWSHEWIALARRRNAQEAFPSSSDLQVGSQYYKALSSFGLRSWLYLIC